MKLRRLGKNHCFEKSSIAIRNDSKLLIQPFCHWTTLTQPHSPSQGSSGFPVLAALPQDGSPARGRKGANQQELQCGHSQSVQGCSWSFKGIFSRDAPPRPAPRKTGCPAPQKGGLAPPRPVKLTKPVGCSGANWLQIPLMAPFHYAYKLCIRGRKSRKIFSFDFAYRLWLSYITEIPF